MTRDTRNERAPSSRVVSVLDFGAVGDGIADDYRPIQAALDSGARHVLVPAGTYATGNVLQPHEGQCVEIHGTIKVADAVIQPLQKDMAIGDSEVAVADGSRFYIGQWVVLHDDRLPIQGGGRKVRRQSGASARIVAIAGNTLTLDGRSARSYLREANALIATMHSVILICHSRVHICGTGTIDGNRKNQFDTAPGFLEKQDGEDWRAGSGIVVSAAPERVSHIVIEGVTVQDTVMHCIGMRDAVQSVIRNTICLRAHDKNITLTRCRECSILNNIAADSEFEDGIIFHQRPDLENASSRILIQGNICSGNPRNGISIGAHMHEVFLANNLCVDNCMNIVINGDNCISSDDVAIGCNDRLHPITQPRANVQITGRTVTLNNLTALGSPSFGVSISGTDVTIRGGIIGDLEPRGEEFDGVGLDFRSGNRASRQPKMTPDRVTITGVTVRGCRKALSMQPDTQRVTLRENDLSGNEQLGDIPAEVWPRLRLENNIGLVTRNRGLARIEPDATRVTVAHGLCRAPELSAVSLTPAGNPGEACRFWVENAGQTSFDIVVDRAPQGDGATFAWQACAE